MTASTVASLTPPHGFDGCLQKSHSIAELKPTSLTFTGSRNEEKFLDSIITLGSGMPVNSAESDYTTLAIDAALLVPVSVAPSSVSRPAPGPGGALASTGLADFVLPSHLQPDDHCLLLGAKTKLVSAAVLDFTPNLRHRALSSTLQHEPWQSVAGSMKADQPTTHL